MARLLSPVQGHHALSVQRDASIFQDLSARRATVTSRQAAPTDWKEVQALVARIEHLAAPKGAKVKSPDRIRDKVTGQLRDVDASIRYRVGTTEILIAIE